jgi:hypothetical protein
MVLIRTRALHTVHQGSFNFPIKILSADTIVHPKKVGSVAVILVTMVVIETMLVVMMMIMVMVLGTLTQVPLHHDLATLLLALSIPAPPTIRKHPFPYYGTFMPLPL